MNDDSRRAPTEQVLFCPFCREAFEGSARCPDHEMQLVAWHQLPREVAPMSDDQRLAPYSLIAGRGWVFLGAGLTLFAFILPMLTMIGETELHANMFRFASLRAGKLWMVPLASIAQAMILFRRRTMRGLRAVRLAVACVALMPSLALGLTLQGVAAAATATTQRTGEEIRITIEWGAYLVFVAALLMLYGAIRLGVPATSTHSTSDQRSAD